jgi:hypothetical protein
MTDKRINKLEKVDNSKVTPQSCKASLAYGKKTNWRNPAFARNYNAIYPRESYITLERDSRIVNYTPDEYYHTKRYALEIAIDTEYKASFKERVNKDNISIQFGVIGHDDAQFEIKTIDSGYFFINNSVKMDYLKKEMINKNPKFYNDFWKSDLTRYDESTKISTYKESDNGPDSPIARVIADQLGVDMYTSMDSTFISGKPKEFKVLLTGFFLTVDVQAAIGATGIVKMYKKVTSGRRLTVNTSTNSEGRVTKELLLSDLCFTLNGEEYQVSFDLRDASGVATSLKELLKQTNMNTDIKTSLDAYKTQMDVGFYTLPNEFVTYGIGDTFDCHKALVKHKENSIRQFITDDDGVIIKKYLVVKQKVIDFSGDHYPSEMMIDRLAKEFGIFPETGGAIDNVLYDNSVLAHINKLMIDNGLDSIYTNIEWFKSIAISVRRTLVFNQNKQSLYLERYDEEKGEYLFTHWDITNSIDAYLNITQGGRFINMNPIANDLTEGVHKALGTDDIKNIDLAGILMDQDLSSCYGKGMSTTRTFYGDARIKYSRHSSITQNNIVLRKLIDPRMIAAFNVEYTENEGLTLDMFMKYIYGNGSLPLEGWLAVISTREDLDHAQTFFVSKPKSKGQSHLSDKRLEDNFITEDDTLKVMSNDKTTIYTHEIINSVFNEGCIDLVRSMVGPRRKDFFKKVYITAFETYLKPDETLFLKEVMGSIIYRSDVEIKRIKKHGKVIEDLIINAEEVGKQGLENLLKLYKDVKTGKKYYKQHVSPNINATINVTLGDLAVNELVQRRKKYKALGKTHSEYYIQGVLKLYINTFYGIQASIYFTASNAIVGNNITMKPRVMTFLMERSTISGSTVTDGAMLRMDLFPDLKKIEKIMGSNFNPWDIIQSIDTDEKGKGIYRFPEIKGERDNEGNYKTHKFPLTTKMMGYEILELIDHGTHSGVLYQSLRIREPNGKVVIYSDLTDADLTFSEDDEHLDELKFNIDSEYVEWIGNHDNKRVIDVDEIMLEYIKKYWDFLMNEDIYKYDLERKMYFNAGEETTQGGGDYKIRNLIRKRGAEGNKTFMDAEGHEYAISPSVELFHNIRGEDGLLNKYVKLPIPKIKNGICKSGYLQVRKEKHNTHLQLGDGIAVIESGHLAPAAVKFRNSKIEHAVMSKLGKVHEDYGIGRAGIAIVMHDGELKIDRLKMNDLMAKLSLCEDVKEVTRIIDNRRKQIKRAINNSVYAEYLNDLIEKDKAVCEYNGLKIELKKWAKGKLIMVKHMVK